MLETQPFMDGIILGIYQEVERQMVSLLELIIPPFILIAVSLENWRG